MAPVTLRRRSICAAIVAVWAFGAASPAAAQPCRDKATPSDLTEASAMAAIFCAFDREHRGTLLPIQFTSPWNSQRAETLASPMLIANGSTCYTRTSGAYTEDRDPKCASYRALDRREVFDVGDLPAKPAGR